MLTAKRTECLGQDKNCPTCGNKQIKGLADTVFRATLKIQLVIKNKGEVKVNISGGNRNMVNEKEVRRTGKRGKFRPE